MKTVVSTVFNPYSELPTWALTLSCGHEMQFKGDSKSNSKPPKQINCAECAEKEGKKTMQVRKGDVIKVQGGKMLICFSFNDSCARFIEMDAGIVEDEPGKFRSTKPFHSLSADMDEDFILERRGDEGLKEFLTANVSRSAKQTNETEGDNESEDNMATEKKTAKKGASKKGAKKSESTAVAVSYKGRSELIRKLKADGMKFDDAYAKINEKFPGSSSANVKKVWDKPAKAEKAEK